jgi:UDP-N-acetylmuramate--alanine ligase
LSLSINGTSCRRLHFAGILGSGMSAIAQYCAWDGMVVSGSDRLLNSADVLNLQDELAKLGCILVPQDGSGVTRGTDALVVSTAIEETNPDIVAARAAGVPVVHRSDVLAAIVTSKATVAVAGTSGKSTVAAMIWEFLDACGKSPSLISGAGLVRLERQGLAGNAYRGSSDILVIEADESDGTCAKYKPYLSVFLNVSKDHKPVPETLCLFSTLARQSNIAVANADDPQLAILGAQRTFGLKGDFAPDKVISVAPGVSFSRGGVTYTLPLPGAHNLSNLLAALCVCDTLGCEGPSLARAASGYMGVQRRFSIVTLQNGIRIIDDYAHNPEKIRAAIRAARLLSPRVLAVFQPHGFGPTRFLKDEFVAMFAEELTSHDMLFLLPIYYAGGTAQKDISSDLIAGLVRDKGKNVSAPRERAELVALIKQHAAPGDAVLVMGARDPSLPWLVDGIAKALTS